MIFSSKQQNNWCKCSFEVSKRDNPILSSPKLKIIIQEMRFIKSFAIIVTFNIICFVMMLRGMMMVWLVIQWFIQLNFQANQNQRQQFYNFTKIQNYSVGNNILLNRLSHLNNIIPLTMTNDSYLTYKIKCKRLFLTMTSWKKPM